MRPKSCFGRKVFRFFSGSLCYSVGKEVKAMKRPKVTGLRRRESWQALPFLLPSLLGLCLFYLFPLAETVRASFMDPLRSRARRVGELPGALSKYCVPSGCPQHPPLSLHLHPGAAGRQPALCGVAWRGKTAGRSFSKASSCSPMRFLLPASLCYGGRFSPARGWSTACWWGWGAGRGLYGQQRGLLGADFHLPLAKQRVRYAAVAGGSGDHPPALV